MCCKTKKKPLKSWIKLNNKNKILNVLVRSVTVQVLFCRNIKWTMLSNDLNTRQQTISARDKPSKLIQREVSNDA